MSIIGNGSNLIIFNSLTGDPIGCQRGATATINDALIDVTCKQDEGYSNFLPGLRTVSISGDALVDWQPAVDTEGISELVSAFEGRTLVKFTIADSTNTDVYFEAEGYIESLEVNAGTESEVTYTFTMAGSGDFISLVS
jgi:predicted secreted protein